MTTRIAFESVTLRDFRNLASVTFDPVSRINVLFGDNGQGKTSLLEALYVIATSRSFRAERSAEMIRVGAESALLRARVTESGVRREQRAAIRVGSRTVTVDGKKPESLAAYAMKTPVVVFHPGDLSIVSGPASGRRTMLDRIALFVDPTSADHRRRYDHASKSRQAALWDRGLHAAELGPLEALMAVHGAGLGQARAEAARRLVEALHPIFGQVAASGLSLEARFVPGGFLDPAELAKSLEQSRARDRERRSAARGPHRDDLELYLEGRSVRRHASQGQQRILTLALKAAELQCVRSARGAEPVLLLDDVSSELDPGRTGAVYEFLHGTPSQVFVTTTRPDLFATPFTAGAERADFHVANGQVVRKPS